MKELKTSAEVGGMGHSVKRKEDARFIRGKGNYTDDVVLPGMLHMDIVRSPYAYAKIKSITEKRPGQFDFVMDLSVEIEGEEKPALVAEWLTVQFAG